MSFFSSLGKLAGGAVGALGGHLIGGWLQGDTSAADGLQTAATQQGQYASADRNRFLGALGGGQEAVNTSTQAAVNNALPSFMKNLQGSREEAIRRGASNGDLQTSNEGDLASAFQRNIASGAGAQAAGVYGQQLQGYGNMATQSSNNYLDLMSGNADREQANRNNRYGLLGGVIGAAGKIGGAFAGGG